MDLGVLLESPQGSPSSSRVGACTCAFLPSCSSVTLPFAWIKVSVAFPRGFPTRFSHEAFPQGSPTCHRDVSRSLARKSRQCREIRFPWNGLRHLGDSGNGGTWDSPVGKPRGKASWESLLGKPRGKSIDPLIHAKGSVTLLLQLRRNEHVHDPTRDED